MGTDFIFLFYFSFLPDGACVSGNFGVLHNLLYAFLGMWHPKNTQKWAKSSKKWPFCGYHGYGFYFFQFFSFHPDRAWLDDHFGVLHDLFHAFTSEKGPQNCQKCQKVLTLATLGVSMATIRFLRQI